VEARDRDLMGTANQMAGVFVQVGRGGRRTVYFVFFHQGM
jgi:hypothetical protein